MYVCMCMCMYMYMHMRMCMCIYLYMYMYMYLYMYAMWIALCDMYPDMWCICVLADKALHPGQCLVQCSILQLQLASACLRKPCAFLFQ